MEKIWFIIKEREHVGPYGQDELFEFYKNGSLEKTSAIWRSGLDEAIALEDILPAENNIVIGKNIEAESNLNFQDDANEDDILSALEESSQEPELPPPLPMISEQESTSSTEEIELQEMNIDTIKLEESRDEILQEEQRVQDLAALIEDDEEDYQEALETEVQEQLQDISELEEADDSQVLLKPDELSLNENHHENLEEDLEFSDDSLEEEMDSAEEYAEEQGEEYNEYSQHQEEAQLSKSFLSTFKGRAIILTGFLIFSGLFKIGLEVYEVYYQGFDKPRAMFSKDYKRLKSAYRNKSMQESAQVAFSKDYGKIWASLNFPYNGRVQISLISKKNSILGEEDVHITSIGNLENKLIEFKSYEFEKGYKVSPGIYTFKMNLIHKEYQSLWLEKFVNLPKTIFVEKEVYIGHMDQLKFEKNLIGFNKRKNSQDKIFWNDLFQRYETLRAISAQIYDDFEQVLKQVQKKNFSKLLKKFERDYRNKYGQFLTSFTLESQNKYEQIQKSIVHDKRELISRHTRLTSLAKAIGSTSMDILIKLERMDIKQDIVGTDHVKSELMGKLVGIEKECNTLIEQIQEKL